MVSFIQQSLELRMSKQWFLLFNSQNKGYQHNGFFYSTVTRTEDIKTIVSLFSSHRTEDTKTMASFIHQSLELGISTQ
jgi:hypothetical protein